MSNSPETWTLVIGWHCRTMTSRDSHVVTSKFDDANQPLTSLEDCIECAKAWQHNFAQIGYFIWFANVAGPDGANHLNVIPSVRYD